MIFDKRVPDKALEIYIQQNKADSLSLKPGYQYFNVTTFYNEYKTKLQEVFNEHCSKTNDDTGVCNTCQETVITKNNSPLYIQYINRIKSDKLKHQREYSCMNSRSKRSERGCKCKNTLSDKVLHEG